MLHVELIIFFSLGYLAIIFEKFLHVNKAAIALVMGVICWLLFFAAHETEAISSAHMGEQLSDIAQIIFFLLAAMVIVELIDSHHGFKIITELLYTSSKKRMLWFLIVISFFMSAVLDNLTTMIVMISLLRKMIPEEKERWFFGSIIVIAVNAGGAWTPIGDVTTTMLWINEKITTISIMKALFIPSVICVVLAGLIATIFVNDNQKKLHSVRDTSPMQPGARCVFVMGAASLLMVPVLKGTLGLPPFMGALIGLGILWLITDIIHYRYGEERWHLRVLHILTKIDVSGILFFLGILLAIDALATAGLLKELAVKLHEFVPNESYIAFIIGLVSSIVDNVPLVAATMGMYDMHTYPVDSSLWQMIAYAAGTGGSVLIIGSAAGVALMGIEKVDFLWYLKKVSWIALLSYIAGFGSYLLLF